MCIVIGKFLAPPVGFTLLTLPRERRREIEEDGCVLVRPDRFVAWRSMELSDHCDQKLGEVMKAVLGKS